MGVSQNVDSAQAAGWVRWSAEIDNVREQVRGLDRGGGAGRCSSDVDEEREQEVFRVHGER